MTDLTPAEKIKAAIKKLRTEIAHATEGTWLGWQEYSPVRGTSYGMEGFVDGEPVNIARGTTRADALLTETMHRTLDAQLAILHRFAEYPNIQLEEPVMALADAILQGGTE